MGGAYYEYYVVLMGHVPVNFYTSDYEKPTDYNDLMRKIEESIKNPKNNLINMIYDLSKKYKCAEVKKVYKPKPISSLDQIKESDLKEKNKINIELN